MIKNNQDENLIHNDLDINEDSKINQKKTTNINILLNRVKMDKRKDFNKKLTFISVMMLGVLILSVYMLI
jgi:hypothetical protein